MAASLFVLMVACAGQAAIPSPTTTPSPPPTPVPTATPTPTPVPTPSLPVAIIGSHVFFLEVADTPEKHTRGLMGRASLPRDVAMLFIFEGDAPWAFWMKDTLIPLDAIWLDAKGVIVDIQTMVPEPGKPDAQLKVYVPRAPARYTLEMNAGLAREYQFATGMSVDLKLSSP